MPRPDDPMPALAATVPLLSMAARVAAWADAYHPADAFAPIMPLLIRDARRHAHPAPDEAVALAIMDALIAAGPQHDAPVPATADTVPALGTACRLARWIARHGHETPGLWRLLYVDATARQWPEPDALDAFEMELELEASTLLEEPAPWPTRPRG